MQFSSPQSNINILKSNTCNGWARRQTDFHDGGQRASEVARFLCSINSFLISFFCATIEGSKLCRWKEIRGRVLLEATRRLNEVELNGEFLRLFCPGRRLNGPLLIVCTEVCYWFCVGLLSVIFNCNVFRLKCFGKLKYHLLNCEGQPKIWMLCVKSANLHFASVVGDGLTYSRHYDIPLIVLISIIST